MIIFLWPWRVWVRLGSPLTWLAVAMPHKLHCCSGRQLLKSPCLLVAAEEEASACLPLLLPCLISILNTSCCCSTDSQLALPLEMQKSDHWFCIAENKEVSVPLLGVWHLMKWCFLRSLHWACLPGRRKAASVCKPGGCNSCLAMLRSQLSS